MKVRTRLLALLLTVVMIVSVLPVGALAGGENGNGHGKGSGADRGKWGPLGPDRETSTALSEANLAKAASYIDSLTINNSANDPTTVVSTFGKQFSWDTEKRESANKSYLFEWSYYNGVVFEGLDYVADATGENKYSNYVSAYLAAMINGNSTTWKKCSNNSSKECAGYNSTHGLDCYKTASLLLDYGYTEIAAKLYADLQNAESKYSAAGGNFKHTWASAPSYNIWLDGIYMAQPFMAEYATSINDTTELNKIAQRFAWIGDNMYNSGTGLFYHAANSATNHSSKYWSRAIGWYAAAMADVIPYMTGDNQTAMIAQLKKLVDGMVQYQDTTGLWRNFVNESGTKLETSGTALVAYAIMKAVNNGWLDEDDYAPIAIKAFNGICENKLDGSNLQDICTKGSPDGANNTFASNEGKGVGPFIMTYAELLKYQAAESTDPDTEPETEPDTEPDTDPETEEPEEQTASVEVGGKSISVVTSSAEEVTLSAAIVEDVVLPAELSKAVAYDLTLEGYEQGTEATVTLPIPEGVSADKVGVCYIPSEGEPVLMEGEVVDGNYYRFTTDHFSTYAIGEYSATSADAGYYRVTSVDEITDGTYIIVRLADNNDKASFALNSSASGTALGAAGDVTKNSTFISANLVADACQMTITKNSDGTFVQNAAGNYLYFSGKGRDSVIKFQSDTASVTITEPKSNDCFALQENNVYLDANGDGKFEAKDKGDDPKLSLFKYNPGTPAEEYEARLSIVPESATLNLYNNDTVTIYPTVEVKVKDADDSTYDPATNYTIEWTSSDETVATVDKNGVVTPVAEGNATITAKLTKVNGQTLTTPISVTCAITVINKLAPLPPYDYTGYGEATEYPEYPEDGAVRIRKSAESGEKFQQTGVTKVELDAAGISVKAGVDVVLVVDVSNSMAWSMDWFDNYENASDYQKVAGYGKNDTTTKFEMAMESASAFADILLGDNDKSTDNSLTFVTFGGYDKQNSAGNNSYVDSVMTVFDSVKSADVAKASFSGSSVTGTVNGTTATYKIKIVDENGNTVVNGTNRGDTNYDFAFYEAAAAINAVQSKYTNYAETGRETYVVFMTDGAPSNYNNYYYRTNTSDAYKPGTKNDYSRLNKQDQDTWYNYISTTQNTYAKSVYDTVNGNMFAVGFDLAHGGFSSYSWEENELKVVLRDMLKETKQGDTERTGAELDVALASDADELMEYYSSLATKIKNAGEKAQVTDIVDSDFTLQIGDTIGTNPARPATMTGNWEEENKIEVKAYDLYTKAETSDMSLIGTRKGTSETLETVTFSADGGEAYSSVLGEEENIMTFGENGSVKIDAYYFTYTKDADGVEKFVWKIGSITEKEVALSYFAYLKGALEGEAENGTYYTNEEAKLDYVDIYGKHATKEFEKPQVIWGGAGTRYEFYLVNENGEPVNSKGVVVPYANRIIIVPPESVEFNLNADQQYEALTIIAKDKLPIGYYLYDDYASYTIEPNTLQASEFNISEPSADASSVKGGKQQNGAQTTILNNPEDTTYLDTYVSFGVRYDLQPLPSEIVLVPDEVVVDFGLPVEINILANDADNLKIEGETVTATLEGFVQYQPGTNLKVKMENGGKATHTLPNKEGTFSICNEEDNNVIFTPEKMMSNVERVFCSVEIDEGEGKDTYYLYEQLTVIPATIVYYEDSFVTFDGNWTNAGTNDGGKQAQDRPDFGKLTEELDADNIYGYDQAYLNCSTYSNGSAKKVTVKKGDRPSAQFTFTGTGFDIIALTSNKTGEVNIDVYEGNAAVGTPIRSWAVDTYYGYKNGEEDGYVKYTCTYDTAWHITSEIVESNVANDDEYVVSALPDVNDETFDSSKKYVMFEKNYSWELVSYDEENDLYQIPVMKSYDELDYGTYTVVVAPRYSAFFDHQGKGQYDFYFDAVRIYNPVKGDKSAENAYMLDKEAYPQFIELRNCLIDPQKAFETEGATVEGAVFIDAFKAITDENDGIEKYTKFGPNNEIYLEKGQGVALTVVKNNAEIASVQISAKCVNGAAGLTVNGSEEPIALATATDLYYDITDLIVWNENGNESDVITLTNNGDNIVSITNLKITFKAEPKEEEPVMLFMTRSLAMKASNMMLTSFVAESPAEPEEEEPIIVEPEIFVPGTFNVKVKDKVKTGEDIKVEITTSSEVAAVKVNGLSAKFEKTDKKTGNKVWSFTMKANEAGELSFYVVAYDANEVASEQIVKMVNIEAKGEKGPGSGPAPKAKP